MNEADKLVGLHDVRWPADAPFQALADLAASLGIGLLLALALVPLLLWASKSRISKADQIGQEIADLRDWPDAQRVPALLNLLEAHAPGATAARFGSNLYAKDALPDIADIERAIRDAA